jgi:hypothetical protein
VSIKGSPSSWFEASVRQGDLLTARSEVYELTRPLHLRYALGLLVLYVEHDDDHAPVATALWLARFALERRPHVDVDDLVDVIDALQVLRDDRAEGRRQLVEIVARHGLDMRGLLVER